VAVAVADRHVTREFVTIDERIADLAARYPGFREQLEAAREPARAIQAELAAAAGLTASELEARMRAAWAEGSAA
jgi:predicted phage tail protein